MTCDAKQFFKPTLIAAALAAAFFAGQRLDGVRDATAAAPATAAAVAPAARRTGLPDFSALVEGNGAAVVNIAVSKRASISRAQFDDSGRWARC